MAERTTAEAIVRILHHVIVDDNVVIPVVDDNGHASGYVLADVLVAGELPEDLEGATSRNGYVSRNRPQFVLLRLVMLTMQKLPTTVAAGGRLSYISLSGGFGTISLGQIWSASANHYGFAVDPSYVNGVFGGASYRPGTSVSYSSSAGDVSFQIDKVTGDGERLEFGASATLGPVGVGLGHWSNENDDKSFTGVAISAGAAGVNLTIGLSNEKNVKVESGVGKADTSILHLGGSLGDSGISYAVQVANSDKLDKDGNDTSQNLIVVTNSLGSGASIIFEHLDPKVGDSSSLIGLKVDF